MAERGGERTVPCSGDEEASWRPFSLAHHLFGAKRTEKVSDFSGAGHWKPKASNEFLRVCKGTHGAEIELWRRKGFQSFHHITRNLIGRSRAYLGWVKSPLATKRVSNHSLLYCS